MLDSPGAFAILAEVEELLKTGSAGAFEQKVAANAVSIATREIAMAKDFAAAERARLRALLGRDGSLAGLCRALCEAIRTGKLDWRSPALADHLRATAREKLIVDQPHYPALRAEEAAKE